MVDFQTLVQILKDMFPTNHFKILHDKEIAFTFDPLSPNEKISHNFNPIQISSNLELSQEPPIQSRSKPTVQNSNFESHYKKAKNRIQKSPSKTPISKINQNLNSNQNLSLIKLSLNNDQSSSPNQKSNSKKSFTLDTVPTTRQRINRL